MRDRATFRSWHYVVTKVLIAQIQYFYQMVAEAQLTQLIKDVSKASEVTLLQHTDKVVDVLARKDMELAIAQKVQKIVWMPQIPSVDKIVDIPLPKWVEVSTVYGVENAVDFPHIALKDLMVSHHEQFLFH